MTLFDLLFLAVFFSTVAALIVAAVLALRGQSSPAFRLLRNWGTGLAVYLAITLTANLFQPQRLLHLGEDLCSDDWCIAVTRSSVTPASAGPLYNVEFRISSRARRVDQRENGVSVQLADDRGRHFDPLPNPRQVPFNTQLHPGESISLTRQFQPPPGTGRAAVLISHSGPGWLIIGEGNFHPPAVWLDGSISIFSLKDEPEG
ncbi:MAG TPA: hypothetical protein VN841_12920 [Bryobacteraceae bacterium]|nr:hypothetical protein [Bryobacteraceae bacterium]